METTLQPISNRLEDNEALANDANCAQFLPPTLEFYDKAGFQPPWISYVVMHNQTPVGFAAFKGAPTNNTVEIAYVTFEPFRKQGYATLACQLLIKEALQHDPNVRITAQTSPTGQYSIWVLQRNGFVLLGTTMDEDEGEVLEWEYIKK